MNDKNKYMPEHLQPQSFDRPVPLVHDETLQGGNRLPFLPDQLGSLVVSGMLPAEGYTPSPEDPAISRVNEHHGRRFEVADVLFQDEHGNRFSKISLKGAGPYKLKKHMAYSADELGFTPHGFASNAAEDRIIAASKELRSLHIDTEYPLAVGRPERFPVANDEGIRNMTIEEIYEEITPGTELPKDHRLNVYVTATPTAVRFEDFRVQYDPEIQDFSKKDKADALGLMRTLAEDMRRSAATPEERQNVFNPEDPASRKEFFINTFPKKLAVSIAKIHERGLVQNSMTAGNALASGGIVDLDSVTGEVLGFGDAKPLPRDALGDLYMVLGGLDTTISHIDPHQKVIREKSTSFQDIVNLLTISGMFWEDGKAVPPVTEYYTPALSVHLNKLSKEYVQEFADNFMQAYAETGKDSSFCETTLAVYKKEHQQYLAAKIEYWKDRVVG